MFCCRPIPHFVPNNMINGQTYRLIDIFKRINLDSHDIDKIYYSFNSFKPDNNGYISIKTIYQKLQLPLTPFLIALFHLLDPTAPERSVSFEIFLLTVWNYLTLDDESVVTFVFNLFNIRKKSSFTRDEINYIFTVLWGESNFIHDKFIVANIDKIPFNKNNKNEVTLDIALKTIFDNPILLLPIYQSQEAFRKGIWNEGLWFRLSESRYRYHHDESIDVILEGFIDDAINIYYLDYLNSLIDLPSRLFNKMNTLRKEDIEKKKQRSKGRQDEVVKKRPSPIDTHPDDNLSPTHQIKGIKYKQVLKEHSKRSDNLLRRLSAGFMLNNTQEKTGLVRRFSIALSNTLKTKKNKTHTENSSSNEKSIEKHNDKYSDKHNDKYSDKHKSSKSKHRKKVVPVSESPYLEGKLPTIESNILFNKKSDKSERNLIANTIGNETNENRKTFDSPRVTKLSTGGSMNNIISTPRRDSPSHSIRLDGTANLLTLTKDSPRLLYGDTRQSFGLTPVIKSNSPKIED